jgi:TP901 family phage tail tape measure protein
VPDRSVTYTFRGNFAGLTAGLTAAGRNVQEFGTKLNGLDKNGRQMRAGLTELSGTAGKFGLLLGGAFALAATKAANFEQAMSFVQAATHETASNMDALRQAALDAGQATSFSATEAAGAIEELAKAGVSTESILNGGLNGALDLAAAGGLDVAKAAEAAASAMTQFGLSGEQVPHIADLLAAGAGKAQGSVEDMSMALNQSGLVAAQTGLTIEETTGALSAFASAGLTGSDAGTSFKTMLQALTPSSKQARELMEELNISAYDTQGNFVGLTEFADSLRAGLSDLSVEQQNAALKTIFGSDAVRAASVIYKEGGAGIQSWIDKTNDSGYAAETAAIRMDNLKGDLEQLGGALETLLIGGGEGQTGFLRELTQGVTDLVNGLNALPGPVKSTGAALLGITALGAGAFWFTSKAVSSIAATREALAALEFQAGATRASLTTLGKSAGVFAIVAASVPSLLGDLDSWNRRKTAMDANAESFDEFSKSIQNSNVGKYAQDFGIDVQKLAQDLYENGESGEYASKVMAELEGRFDGFGDSMQALGGDILPFYKDAANKAYDASHDLGDIIKNNGDIVGASAEDARKAAVEQANLAGVNLTLADAAGMSAEQIELTGDQLEAIQKAASQTSSSFLTFGDSLNNSKVSLGDWIGEMEKQAQALREFTRNSKRAAREGLDEGLIQSLQDAGVEGAMRMEQLANASDAEIKRANRAFRQGQRATDDYAQSVEDLARAAAGLPPNPRMDVSVTGVDAGLSKLRDIINQAKQIPREIRTNYIVNQINRANKIGAGEAGPGAGKKAMGGLVTGPGGPTDDLIPTWLSNREYVIPASAVSKYGVGFFDAIRAERLAGGGQPGGGSKDKGSFLIAPGFGALAELDHLPKSLKALIKWVDASSNALEGEISARKSLSDSLSSAVSSKITSDLFGSTDVWSKGGTFEDVMSKLGGDIATGNALKANISMLQSKGLDGPALDALLAQGDSATIANFAALSAAQLDQYEQTYQVRADLAASVGAQAAAAAGYTAQIMALQAKVDQTNALLAQLNGIQKAAPDKTGKAVGKAGKRGASNASRNIKRS